MKLQPECISQIAEIIFQTRSNVQAKTMYQERRWRNEEERQKTTTTPAAPHPARPVQNDTAPVIPERKRAAPVVKESNFTIRRTTARKEWTKAVTAADKQKKGEKP